MRPNELPKVTEVDKDAYYVEDRDGFPTHAIKGSDLIASVLEDAPEGMPSWSIDYNEKITAGKQIVVAEFEFDTAQIRADFGDSENIVRLNYSASILCTNQFVLVSELSTSDISIEGQVYIGTDGAINLTSYNNPIMYTNGEMRISPFTWHVENFNPALTDDNIKLQLCMDDSYIQTYINYFGSTPFILQNLTADFPIAFTEGTGQDSTIATFNKIEVSRVGIAYDTTENKYELDRVTKGVAGVEDDELVVMEQIRTTATTPPTAGYNRKLAGMKLNYADIALKVPNEADEYSYECTIEVNASDEYNAEPMIVRLKMKFVRQSTGIYMLMWGPSFSGNWSTLAIRGYQTNIDPNNGAGPIQDIEHIDDVHFSTGTNSNLNEDSTIEYNIYTSWTGGTRAWAKVIDESELGIVNFSEDLLPNANVLSMSEQEYFRQVRTNWNGTRRGYELPYVNGDMDIDGEISAKNINYINAKNINAVFIGNSLTEGFGTTGGDKAYPYLINEDWGFKSYTNLAVGGATVMTTAGMTEMSTQVAAIPANADLITGMFVVNDWGEDNPVGDEKEVLAKPIEDLVYNLTYAEALLKNLENLRTNHPDATIIFFTGLRFKDELTANANIQEFIRVTKLLCMEYSIRLVDTYNTSGIWKRCPYFTDLVHLDDAGQRLLADKCVKPAIISQSTSAAQPYVEADDIGQDVVDFKNRAVKAESHRVGDAGDLFEYTSSTNLSHNIKLEDGNFIHISDGIGILQQTNTTGTTWYVTPVGIAGNPVASFSKLMTLGIDGVLKDITSAQFAKNIKFGTGANIFNGNGTNAQWLDMAYNIEYDGGYKLINDGVGMMCEASNTAYTFYSAASGLAGSACVFTVIAQFKADGTLDMLNHNIDNVAELTASGEIYKNGNEKVLAEGNELANAFLYYTTPTPLTVGPGVFASPTSATLAVKSLESFSYGTGLINLGPLKKYVITSSVSMTTDTINTKTSFYIAKNWTSGSPSVEDLLGVRTKKASPGDNESSVTMEWHVTLDTGDSLDLVLTADKTSITTLQNGTFHVTAETL